MPLEVLDALVKNVNYTPGGAIVVDCSRSDKVVTLLVEVFSGYGLHAHTALFK